MDRLVASVARGIGQVIVLGAGLDTTGYRGLLPPAVKVFEVDHPATQASKKETLRAAGIPAPPSVAFVPLDSTR
jgi:methyltransferase (TIGR00027 family)